MPAGEILQGTAAITGADQTLLADAEIVAGPSADEILTATATIAVGALDAYMASWSAAAALQGFSMGWEMEWKGIIIPEKYLGGTISWDYDIFRDAQILRFQLISDTGNLFDSPLIKNGDALQPYLTFNGHRHTMLPGFAAMPKEEGAKYAASITEIMCITKLGRILDTPAMNSYPYQDKESDGVINGIGDECEIVAKDSATQIELKSGQVRTGGQLWNVIANTAVNLDNIDPNGDTWGTDNKLGQWLIYIAPQSNDLAMTQEGLPAYGVPLASFNVFVIGQTITSAIMVSQREILFQNPVMGEYVRDILTDAYADAGATLPTMEIPDGAAILKPIRFDGQGALDSIRKLIRSADWYLFDTPEGTIRAEKLAIKDEPDIVFDERNIIGRPRVIPPGEEAWNDVTVIGQTEKIRRAGSFLELKKEYPITVGPYNIRAGASAPVKTEIPTASGHYYLDAESSEQKFKEGFVQRQFEGSIPTEEEHRVENYRRIPYRDTGDAGAKFWDASHRGNVRYFTDHYETWGKSGEWRISRKFNALNYCTQERWYFRGRLNIPVTYSIAGGAPGGYYGWTWDSDHWIPNGVDGAGGVPYSRIGELTWLYDVDPNGYLKSKELIIYQLELINDPNGTSDNGWTPEDQQGTWRVASSSAVWNTHSLGSIRYRIIGPDTYFVDVDSSFAFFLSTNIWWDSTWSAVYGSLTRPLDDDNVSAAMAQQIIQDLSSTTPGEQQGRPPRAQHNDDVVEAKPIGAQRIVDSLQDANDPKVPPIMSDDYAEDVYGLDRVANKEIRDSNSTFVIVESWPAPGVRFGQTVRVDAPAAGLSETMGMLTGQKGSVTTGAAIDAKETFKVWMPPY